MARGFIFFMFVSVYFCNTLKCFAFWDDGTTTEEETLVTADPRVAFYQWEIVKSKMTSGFFGSIFFGPDKDFELMEGRRTSQHAAGFSIGFQPLALGTLLNRRTLITGANFLEPYLNRMREVRIWALGRSGSNIHPWRYRVWRWRRIFPRSMNPEHQHGARGRHSPRHDLAIVHSWDQMYVENIGAFSWFNYMYAMRAKLAPEMHIITGCKMLVHVGLYSITSTVVSHTLLDWMNIVNCEKYLPKWWGKFICVKNIPYKSKGVMEGDGLFADNVLVGVGCFEIRYNDDRVLVFTDLRVYYKWIHTFANISQGEYYEYAYPHWGSDAGLIELYRSYSNSPQIPQVMNDQLPLGK